MRYCFGKIIQRELDDFVTEWNSHRIRLSKMVEAPSGVPNVLFSYPELHGILYKN